jgi:hypothetical protein
VEKMNRKFVMVVAFDEKIRIINNPLASLDMVASTRVNNDKPLVRLI